MSLRELLCLCEVTWLLFTLGGLLLQIISALVESRFMECVNCTKSGDCLGR